MCYFGQARLKPRLRIHRSSFIVHRSSFIVHRSSFIVHRSSFIVHRSSFIVHRSSFIVHRSSFIVHRSSFIVHRSSFSSMSTLYLVATPIGNLEDISARALRMLREVALIAAEDTRVTRHLLSHFAIATPLVAYTDAYQRQKAGRQARVLQTLDAGQDVALVSDAGTPGLSDPGYELVQAALAAGHAVQAIPGPSAIATALVASGLPADRFLFVGFLPRKAAERRSLLAELADEPGTWIAFETPHRLLDALADLLAVQGDRQLAVARELTKRFEEIWRGPASGALGHYTANPPRGEITLVVAGTGRRRDQERWPEARLREAIELLIGEGMAPSGIARAAARLSGWPRAEVYELVVGWE
jgi:16S rRNA (cytidine1402-2'-O)-methyltransferase